MGPNASIIDSSDLTQGGDDPKNIISMSIRARTITLEYFEDVQVCCFQKKKNNNNNNHIDNTPNTACA